MPSVMTPSADGGFYVPGAQGFYRPVQPRTTAQAQTAPVAQNADASSTGTTALAAADVSDGTDALSLAAAQQAAIQLSSALSASDLNLLQGQGLVGSFSSLLGSGSASNALLGGGTQAGAPAAQADRVLLQQILRELSALKAQVTDAARQSQEPATANGSKILRFLVNGGDVLASCQQVFFSSQESDGSFLLTGDRKQDDGAEAETFYLLFHANGSSNAITSYTVTPSLSQNARNEASPLYPLSQQAALAATRTGNLVALHAKEDGLTLDLLLSLDK